MDKDFEKFNETAEFLKVLAHPVRLCIVTGLIEKGKCNVSYMQSCLDIPQSTISQHLQKLRAVGIIEGERKGLEINYTVCDERTKKLIEVILKQQS